MPPGLAGFGNFGPAAQSLGSGAVPEAFQQLASAFMAAQGELSLFGGCLTSVQYASLSQGWTCSDKFTYCYTVIKVADPAFYLTRSQYSDTGLTSLGAGVG